MIEFIGAPAVPTDYPLLAFLSQDEIGYARDAGYVGDDENITGAIKRIGIDNHERSEIPNDLRNWRTRMAILWFCFIYENFLDIRRPLLAIEELILEFKGLGMIDPMLASLYAGAGAADSSSNYERAMQRNRLEPYYKKARKLVEESCHTSRLP